LFDMHGNVWEWCSDWYGDYATTPVDDPTGPVDAIARVLRGGGWDYVGRLCRSAIRFRLEPGLRSSNVGFRVAQGQSSE
jgi:formylglycine-generating enzyme required for sulfatase activity